MNIAAVKKLINSCAPVVSGVLTSLSIFIYRLFNGSKQYEYIIPLLCGALCTVLSMLIIERVRKKKADKKESQAEIQADVIKEKHTFYSEQIKLHQQGSLLFLAYEAKIIELLNLEGKSIQERQNVIDSLEREIREADSFIDESADKLSEMANKKRAS